jgi:hypothetical protein
MGRGITAPEAISENAATWKTMAPHREQRDKRGHRGRQAIRSAELTKIEARQAWPPLDCVRYLTLTYLVTGTLNTPGH